MYLPMCIDLKNFGPLTGIKSWSSGQICRYQIRMMIVLEDALSYAVAGRKVEGTSNEKYGLSEEIDDLLLLQNVRGRTIIRDILGRAR